MLIIIAFVVGGYLGGILGLFVAVPVAATLRILFLYAYQRVYS
jgi:predicted PurR-regulated permease PerM